MAGNEMPKLRDEHKRLSAFEGMWRGEETIYPSPWETNGGKAMGVFRNRLDLDGFALFSDYTEERDGKVVFRGHGIYAHDSKAYRMYWFDSIGATPDGWSTGQWIGDSLVFLEATPVGVNRMTLQLVNANEHIFRMETSPDGTNWKPTMEGRYKRQ